MALQTIQAVAVRYKTASIIFHGGEPTLMGTDYLEKAIQTLGQRTYSIQSNLIDPPNELTRLLYIYFGGKIGTSFDIGRVPVITQWLASIQTLSGNGVRITALVTITNDITTKDLMRYIERFEKAGGSGFRLQFVTPINCAPVSPEHYMEIYMALHDHPLNESSRRVSEALCAGIIGINGGNCARKVRTINPDGTVFICPEFAGQGIQPLGTVHDSSKTSRSPHVRSLTEYHKREKQLALSCCDEYWQICRGGCYANAYFGASSGYEDPYCFTYKTLFALEGDGRESLQFV
jgi:radical SAM protein with 4Fe4S-binding SPASM domain